MGQKTEKSMWIKILFIIAQKLISIMECFIFNIENLESQKENN